VVDDAEDGGVDWGKRLIERLGRLPTPDSEDARTGAGLSRVDRVHTDAVRNSVLVDRLDPDQFPAA